jgi:hypothetical protein
MQSNEVIFFKSKGTFYLFLPHFREPKKLGKLKDGVLIIHRKRNSHFYRNGQIIRINSELLNNYSYLYDKIKIVFDKRIFYIDSEYFKYFGKRIKFGGWGEQIYLTIPQLEEYKEWKKDERSN